VVDPDFYEIPRTPVHTMHRGVFLFRKHFLQGCCLICFGMGLILGHCLESWILCCPGGCAIVLLGLCSEPLMDLIREVARGIY